MLAVFHILFETIFMLTFAVDFYLVFVDNRRNLSLRSFLADKNINVSVMRSRFICTILRLLAISIQRVEEKDTVYGIGEMLSCKPYE